MITVLLVTQFVISIVLVIAILLQKSSSIGLGAYSGSNESLFGAKGPAGFLAKFTFFFGLLFILNTLGLGYYYNTNNKNSLAEEIVNDKKAIPANPIDAKKGNSSAPQAPLAPVAPQKETK